MVEKLIKLTLAGLLLIINIQPALVGAISIGTPVQLVVPDTSFTIQGKSSPNSLVTVKDGTSVVATVSADSNGDFLSTVLTSPGLHDISAYYVDAATRKSEVVSKSISVQPQQDFLTSMFLSPTINRSTPSPTVRGSIVQIRGYTYANASVKLDIDFGSFSESTSANANGFYEFLIDSNSINSGVHTANVVAFVGLEQSAVSKDVSFEVQDAVEQLILDLVVSPDQLPPPTSYTPSDGSTIDNNTVTVRGESVPFAQINVYENEVIIGSTTVDEHGQWEFEYVAKFSPVSLSFEACVDDRCSILSRSITLNFTTTIECDVEFSLNEYRFWGLYEGDSVKISLVDPNNASVLGISWGDGESTEYDQVSD